MSGNLTVTIDCPCCDEVNFFKIRYERKLNSYVEARVGQESGVKKCQFCEIEKPLQYGIYGFSPNNEGPYYYEVEFCSHDCMQSKFKELNLPASVTMPLT